MSISKRSYVQFDSKKSENGNETSESGGESGDEEHLKKLNPDKFVESYGTYGRYQILTYVLVQTLNFFYSSSMYVMSYVQLNLETQCVYENQTLSISQTCVIETGYEGKYAHLNEKYCGEAEKTTLNVTNHNSDTNLLVDFGLVCSHWFFQEFGLTIFTIAAVIAVPFMSMLADRYGRKPIIVSNAIIAFIANVAASFSPNFGVFLALRAIVGASSDTYISVASVVTCEYITEKARAWITVVYNVAWALGMVWTLMVTLMTDQWRWRYFITVFPGIYAFLLWCLLPESPHWLITKNKTEQLKKYIKTANKVNQTTPDFSDCQQNAHHEEKNESWRALVGSNKLLWILFANGIIEFPDSIAQVMVCRMVISLVYFAISFLSVELGDDNVQAFLYSSVVEIPAGLAVLPLMMKMGRKTIVIWCLVIQTVSLFGVTIFLDIYILKLLMLLICKIMATVIYSVHPIWATEQFPTSVRSLCFSLMNVPQSIGIILSPYLKHIVMAPNWLPFLVIALFSLVSATLSFMLQETKNMKLPTDVESLSNAGDVADLTEFRDMPSSSLSSMSNCSIVSKTTSSNEKISEKTATSLTRTGKENDE